MRHVKKFGKINESISQTDIDRLREIRNELESLTREAGDIIRHSDNRMAWERARSYWYAHIISALGDSEYVGGSMTTMEDTITDLEDDVVIEDEDLDDED